MKFRVELWRVVKFLLITFAVNLPLTLINSALVHSLVTSGQPGIGTWLSALTYGQIFLSTTALTLLHRYFTFRATEKWFIALPIMLIAAIAWQFVQAYVLSVTAKQGVEALTALTAVMPVFWLSLQYLLQRCVIYCHTIDQNGWYARFHPTNEKGE